ncbi:MAG: ABC transporter ATP-binding protein [Candidimonas sp.]|nr:MAG: ABC transporter ATP-binding protein [Candidimonas sp.]TAM25744.1 MAG: ABC transporter ATP-binding protein [Candidimonas sp.]TAM74043.1 MAG: ABC transporter ATP-binding protein [Candidimonas sp.]
MTIDTTPTSKVTAALEVDGLCVEFSMRGKQVSVLSDVSLSIRHGQTLAIVGESGCGKSMTALAIMRLIPSPPGRISAGRILFNGENLIQASERRIREIRGRDISMIFQEPMTSLNPVYTIGNQIAETIRRHQKGSSADVREQVLDLLRLVQIPAPERRIDEYPHQLSGGMRQRIMIAIALACEPAILIADEPTTALDVTVQAQIFDLLKDIQAKRRTSMVLITHDFGVVAEMADRVVVMYAGRKIEEGSVEEVINDPRHPYTRGLLRCMPQIKLDSILAAKPLAEIPGTVPDLLVQPRGCPFAPRCPSVMAKCIEMPPSVQLGEQRSARCWLAHEPATTGEQHV